MCFGIKPSLHQGALQAPDLNNVIPYSIPDTTQALNNTWSSEKTYPSYGEFKVVLLYQGKKDGENFNLLSDTLLIKVN